MSLETCTESFRRERAGEGPPVEGSRVWAARASAGVGLYLVSIESGKLLTTITDVNAHVSPPAEGHGGFHIIFHGRLFVWWPCPSSYANKLLPPTSLLAVRNETSKCIGK